MYPTIGVNSNNANSVHPLKAWRERDVNNLLAQLPGQVWATDVNRCHFEAPIPGRPFPLYITLSPSYPSEPPMLAVGQPMAHAWVDSTQRVRSERLRRWTAAEASWSPLAAVVREALDALSEDLHNPQQHQQHANQAYHSNHSNQSSFTFPEVDGLSNDQLREVLSSDGAFDDLLEKVVQRSLSPSNANLQRLRQHNADLAGRTQSLMEQCRELSNQINIIRVSDYQPTRQQYDALHMRQAAVLDKLSPAVLLRQLEAAAHMAEESSDELVQKLLRGEVQVEEFLEEYVPLRSLFHTRELKATEAQKHLVAPTT